MHGTPVPSKLAGPALSDREAIQDACLRSFASIDHAEIELLESAVTKDVHTDIANKVCEGYEELKNKVWQHVAHNLDTVHYLTNFRISIDTPTTAKVNFSVMAVHSPVGKGYDATKFSTGAIYECDAVKLDGNDWRLKTMKSNHVFGDGDPSIMAPPGAH